MFIAQVFMARSKKKNKTITLIAWVLGKWKNAYKRDKKKILKQISKSDTYIYLHYSTFKDFLKIYFLDL